MSSFADLRLIVADLDGTLLDDEKQLDSFGMGMPKRKTAVIPSHRASRLSRGAADRSSRRPDRF